LPTILFSDAHLYLHHQELEQLEAMIARWGKAIDHQRRVDHVLTVVATRRTMHKEFAR
jgi:hypothetical protein